MHYGVNLPIGGVCGDPGRLAEFAALAETAGWDGVFLEDYIVYQGHQDWPTCDPWVALTAMALRTRRIRLGTEITPLARRRPWKLARETVSVDHLSDGRLILGVGLGDLGDPGFTHVGEVLDARERAAMLDEALEVLTGLWSGEPYSHEGQHYQVRDVTFLPRSRQVPRIPIWVSGSYPHQGPMRRAACWDGYCVYRANDDGRWQDLTPLEVHDVKDFIARQRTTTAPFDLVLGGRERRDDWAHEQNYIRALGEAGATWWVEWVAPADVAAMHAAIARGPLRVEV
jgi:alkanesulfonate monooxygenase SsuD/methylene tetrahydromethanopterin reductase-like flavin-dependent oxidoreductase (luciferase family)